MSGIPSDSRLDSTLSFLADPYRFVSARCRELHTDVFETRLMLRRAVCVMGEEAARVFYHPNRFTRRGAVPVTALMLLQDKGSAAVLDGAAHRHRKQMLMSLLPPGRVQDLSRAFAREWHARVARWEGMDHIVLATEVARILTRAVCAWAGIPLRDVDAEQRTRELVAMYEGAGAVGPRNWRGMGLRARTERWARQIIERARTGELAAPLDSPVHVLASHRELDGQLMDPRHAAVELLNLLRPTVAVERYITFAAHALVRHPECRDALEADDDEEYLEWFAQEVRRDYPFFPLVGGRALAAFEWRGHQFREGDWVLLDLYGTNHDPRSWSDPDEFRPERFAMQRGSAFNFIPQGGGNHLANHRCAGEVVTVELMKSAIRLLTRTVTYDVPDQDLTIDMARMPAVPRSGVVLTNVRWAADAPVLPSQPTTA
jgi:fatty-acid peroxygenase